MRKVLIIGSLLAASLLAGCQDQAQIASHNLSKAADNFEINRRIVFFNGITDSYLLSIEGRCSFEVEGGNVKVAVTCKISPTEYKKHTLGLSDNVSFFSEQLESANVSAYHYRVTFRPQTILPDVDFQGSTTDLPRSQ